MSKLLRDMYDLVTWYAQNRRTQLAILLLQRIQPYLDYPTALQIVKGLTPSTGE
jgi:hypothetical protein